MKKKTKWEILNWNLYFFCEITQMCKVSVELTMLKRSYKKVMKQKTRTAKRSRGVNYHLKSDETRIMNHVKFVPQKLSKSYCLEIIKDFLKKNLLLLFQCLSSLKMLEKFDEKNFWNLYILIFLVLKMGILLILKMISFTNF